MDKKGGVQLGTKIENNEDPLLFFIKTHSNGYLDKSSNTAKIFNPNEIMVYQILELLGIGCINHVFWRDPINLYIATKNAGKNY